MFNEFLMLMVQKITKYNFGNTLVNGPILTIN